MGRPAGPKERNSGKWTEARFRSFIVSALRQASRKWGPLNEAKKGARTRRGYYECAECKEEVPLTSKNRTKRGEKNVFVDHIEPIVNPTTGFTTYDQFVENLFCELPGLQVLCRKCHEVKTNEERAQHAERRQAERDRLSE